MAKRMQYRPPLIEAKKFKLEEIDPAIKKLKRRIDEVRALNPQFISHDDASVETAEKNIRESIREIFGQNSPEFDDYKYYQIWQGPPAGVGSEEAQSYFAKGIPQTIKMLEGLIRWLEEKREELSGSSVAVKPNSNELSLHSAVDSKCRDLFEKGHYVEAVEKSFKVVRDRLRQLTGYETGSEAFGKGKLHIKGASAPNVDEDFNEGVKFLTMAIDKFRNEKSHTSNAKIDDPNHAGEYLQLSSLAMNLLDNAELKQN
ncbi:MAG: TIGR02391 family protein [Deltaproteobacteria bacterium RIFCSPLOWO2_01_44_7]|nr:MAG: TIGR02391 family protein [Deltaproteobacteria bacterium RIFCSPHIGHO2_01_FULL_43_49]OGQ16577.1 MAG: TIGR02391 family protein [Deltaproteobacteria bacterium RIFCSPHIGHO2_02_FULL_44_53]OGQ28393.1 MAG: TIGR02391 family protein [Deltaproteobacteria bacterium RIFCSPHIGHO2_12_FULL_44_21]OGQ32464.1 MAG: TIGR02391 family protein [Deltaproteobacteria bacterium RIFCSPLOWO2_01_FULL_45_74]OGQ39118.1 MAG: TIGR02391 family protein [Deltaproteobacteria bacterium RIFCSPLOWO2_01_44_7]OGQ41590.1 MAG: TIG